MITDAPVQEDKRVPFDQLVPIEEGPVVRRNKLAKAMPPIKSTNDDSDEQLVVVVVRPERPTEEVLEVGRRGLLEPSSIRQ